MGRAVRDPYEVLEIDRHATTAEVRAAFRRLAAAHHPDRNPDDPGAQERFQQVNAAYQILSDPQKRAAYDRLGPAAFRPGGSGADPAAVAFSVLDGLFGDLLGAVGIRSGNRGDLRQRVKLSFEEAALGCTKEVRYERADRCGRCGGGGGEPGCDLGVCPNCGGRGRSRYRRGPVSIPVERTCPRCRGSGQIPLSRCSECNGRGLVSVTRTVQVDIPPGAESKSTRVIPRGGSRPRPDRPPGDLEVEVAVAPHALFRREGDDVRCDITVGFPAATLGGNVQVPTLDGNIRLHIPPGTQAGSVLRVRGRGIPHRLRSGRGDQLVRVTIGVPTELSERARTLVAELGQELGEDIGPAPESLLDRLKHIFD